MIVFMDGPAMGQVLTLKRAPVVLRVVCGFGNRWDALDQVDDTAEPDEHIFVYKRRKHPGSYHVKCSKKSQSGFFLSAEYRLFEVQPPDDVVRDNDRWSAWCRKNEMEIMDGVETLGPGDPAV